MATLELIHLYPSPYSERVRWALAIKGLPHAARDYQPLVGESDLRRTTGLSTVPVLLADGDVVGDSDAAVDWLEDHQPSPPLLPGDPHERAQVRSWETVATEVLAPFARLVAIGQWKAANVQPLADHFAAKYGWSPEAETRGLAVLMRVTSDLARAVAPGRYLVGGAFTRADLTVACMLATVLGHPPDDLFRLDPTFRAMFGLPAGADPALAPLAAWRDELYRRHRGGPVAPAA